MPDVESGGAGKHEVLRPQSLKDAVYDRLQALLIEREFSPGQHLVESDLADRLGVSRGPVREALRELEREGWIEVLPRQGAFVHEPTEKEVRDFFEVRSLLESQAARLAAERSRAYADDLLAPILAAGRDLSRPGTSGQERADLTSQFHLAIADLAENGLLRKLAAELNSRTRWYFRPLVDEIAPRAWEEHADIARAIIRGNGDRAAKLMGRHIDWSYRTYRSHISEQERSGDVDSSVDA